MSTDKPLKEYERVLIQKVHPDAKVPTGATTGSAGFDLVAVSKEYDPSRDQITYDVGLAFELPKGWAGLLFPRSSIKNYDLTLCNGIGLLDSDYRGSVKLVFNCHKVPNRRIYNVGDRIGQLMVIKLTEFVFANAANLSKTDRDKGGFGSTGA
jgi:dUTP pyrophosphatase